MNHSDLLVATALKAYKINFGHLDPESAEGLRAFAWCLKKVKAVLN